MDDSFAPPPPSDSFAPPDAFGAPADEFVPPPAADSYTAAPADPYSPPPAEMDGGMGGMGFGAPDAGMGMPAPQSSAMDEFTRKWEAEIQAKDEEEQEAKKAAVVKARGELETAEVERLTLRDSNMAKNRSEEQVRARYHRARARPPPPRPSPHTHARRSFARPAPQLLMEQIEADLEAENPWARVIKLVDLQAEHSDKNLDVSRMRQLFIQLKNEPVVRP